MLNFEQLRQVVLTHDAIIRLSKDLANEIRVMEETCDLDQVNMVVEELTHARYYLIEGTDEALLVSWAIYLAQAVQRRKQIKADNEKGTKQ